MLEPSGSYRLRELRSTTYTDGPPAVLLPTVDRVVDAIASQEGKTPTLVSLRSGTYLHYVCVVFSLPRAVQSFDHVLG